MSNNPIADAIAVCPKQSASSLADHFSPLFGKTNTQLAMAVGDANAIAKAQAMLSMRFACGRLKEEREMDTTSTTMVLRYFASAKKNSTAKKKVLY